MAGLLTHLAISLFGLITIGVFFKWKYGLIFGFAHLLPDLIDFGITGIYIGSLKPSVIIYSNLFYPLKVFGHSFFNWFIISCLILVIFLILYYFKKIQRKHLITIVFLILFFLIGVYLHLWLDLVINEANHWI